jgi:hypothetical protein
VGGAEASLFISFANGSFCNWKFWFGPRLSPLASTMSGFTEPNSLVIGLLTAGGLAPCLSAAVGYLIAKYGSRYPDIKIICYKNGYKGLLQVKRIKDYLTHYPIDKLSLSLVLGRLRDCAQGVLPRREGAPVTRRLVHRK